jgi:mannose-6-phosphate isomerase-like protein (cupin superfamily)
MKNNQKKSNNINMSTESINLNQKFKLFSDNWSPKVIAELNDYQIKLIKINGEFIWHSHDDTDEAFIVINGELTIKFRDGKVDIKKGEMFIVPKGVEHKPIAKNECQIMVIEPKGVVNTGDKKSDLTAKNNVWI